MKVKMKTENGYNIMNSFEIEEFICSKIEQVPGVINLTGRSAISKLLSMLSKNRHYGVEVDYLSRNRVGISVYVVIDSELNITDVTLSVQDVVKYSLEKYYGLKVKYVDVYVRGIN